MCDYHQGATTAKKKGEDTLKCPRHRSQKKKDLEDKKSSDDLVDFSNDMFPDIKY